MYSIKVLIVVLLSLVFSSGCAARLADGARATAPDGTCTNPDGDERDRSACLETKLMTQANASRQRELALLDLIKQARDGKAIGNAPTAPPAVPAARAAAIPAAVPATVGFVPTAIIPTATGPYGQIGKEWYVLLYNNTDQFAAVPAGMAPFPSDLSLFTPVTAQRQDGSVVRVPMVPPHSRARIVPAIMTRPGFLGQPLASGLGEKPLIFEVYSPMGANQPAVLSGKSTPQMYFFPKRTPSLKCSNVNSCAVLDDITIHDIR